MQMWQKSEIFNEASVFVMHQTDRVMPTDKGRRAFTLAAIVDRNGTVCVGSAVVNPLDDYDKTIGRNIAVGRAKLVLAGCYRLNRMVDRNSRAFTFGTGPNELNILVGEAHRRLMGEGSQKNKPGTDKLAKFLSRVVMCSKEKVGGNVDGG